MSKLFNRFMQSVPHWVYRFRIWVIILILMRITSFFIYQETGIGIRNMLDSKDYFSTAENVLNGNGFISNEHNPSNHRAYLGDNYYYAAEPGYPVFLLFFFPNKVDQVLITVFSNSLLYLIIMLLTWKSLSLLRVNKRFHLIAMLLLLINPHIIHYSLRGVPELLRMTVILMFFYYLLHIILKGRAYRYSQIILLGFLGGFTILTRISFLLIPFILFPLIFKYSNRKQINSVIYITSVFIILVPWVFRNYHDFGVATVDMRIYQKMRYGEITDLPEGVDRQKNELASGIWRITDNEKWLKLSKETDAGQRNKILEDIENTPLQWFKMYNLRIWELFKPYPQDGKLLERMQLTVFRSLNPEISKIILQIYSLLIYLPWFLGFILFIGGKVRALKPMWLFFSLGLLSFVGIHVLQNSPHARYMLPLIPIGYITFFTYFDQKWREGFKLFKHEYGEV